MTKHGGFAENAQVFGIPFDPFGFPLSSAMDAPRSKAKAFGGVIAEKCGATLKSRE
jgi:hypothetical protein